MGNKSEREGKCVYVVGKRGKRDGGKVGKEGGWEGGREGRGRGLWEGGGKWGGAVCGCDLPALLIIVTADLMRRHPGMLRPETSTWRLREEEEEGGREEEDGRGGRVIKRGIGREDKEGREEGETGGEE